MSSSKVLDVPAKSLPALVEWTLKEAQLGAGRLHGSGKDADPLLVLSRRPSTTLPGSGFPPTGPRTAARAAARHLPDGTWQTLPERATALEIRDELHKLGALGVTTWLEGADCPLLLVQASRRLPPATGMEWFDDFSTLFGQEVSDELAALSRTRPTITVNRIDATHAMNLEAPEAVATLVADFVRELLQPS